MFENINLILENKGIVKFFMGFVSMMFVATMMVSAFANCINDTCEDTNTITEKVNVICAEDAEIEQLTYKLFRLEQQLTA